MNDNLIAHLDAMLERLMAEQASSQRAADKATAGERARLAMADNSEFVAMLRPGQRGTLTGPWVDFTCPKGHVIGPVRAVHDGNQYGQVHLDGGRKVQENTSSASHLQRDTALVGPFLEHELTARLTQRRVWRCPMCGWHTPATEVYLMRLYVAAMAGGHRRVSLVGALF